MTRKLNDNDIKEWKKAIKAGFRNQDLGLSEKRTEPKAKTPMPKLDLHGLTLEKAHKKFLDFVAIEFMAGSKKLLVVTGKGNPGKIKYELPLWCNAAPLNEIVTSCKQAELKHGGAGAFYVTVRQGFSL